MRTRHGVELDYSAWDVVDTPFLAAAEATCACSYVLCKRMAVGLVWWAGALAMRLASLKPGAVHIYKRGLSCVLCALRTTDVQGEAVQDSMAWAIRGGRSRRRATAGAKQKKGCAPFPPPPTLHP